MAISATPLHTSTVLMVGGMGAFVVCLPVAFLAAMSSADGYGGAVIALGILLLGVATFACLSIPAAVYSFVAAWRDPGRDTHGAILARMFVAATLIIGAVLYAKHLA